MKIPLPPPPDELKPDCTNFKKTHHTEQPLCRGFGGGTPSPTGALVRRGFGGKSPKQGFSTNDYYSLKESDI